MGKINVKESLFEVVNGNNLEILKIDLCNESGLVVYGGSIFKVDIYTI